MPLDLRLLGPLELRCDGIPYAVGSPQQRRLLAMLALRVGSSVSLDEIVAAVWPGEPAASASTAVHSYVSRLRSLPGPATGRPGAAVVVGSSDGYALDVADDCVDVVRFDRLSQCGLRALAAGDAATAVRDLGEALALWRGPLLGTWSSPAPSTASVNGSWRLTSRRATGGTTPSSRWGVPPTSSPSCCSGSLRRRCTSRRTCTS